MNLKISCFLTFLLIGGLLNAQTPTSFSDYLSSGQTPTVGTVKIPAIHQEENGVTIDVAGNENSAALVVCVGDAIFEDFSTNLVPPGGVVACNPTINCLTGDACFAPGNLQCGFSIVNILNTTGPDDLVILESGSVFGNLIPLIGSNTLGDNFEITFDQPTNQIEFDAGGFDGDMYDVAAYDDMGNLLVNAPITAGGFDNLTNVKISSASENVARILFTDVTAMAGILIGNLSFCIPPPVVEVTKSVELRLEDGAGYLDYTIDVSVSENIARDVVFASPVDPKTALVNGSVTTTQGSVTMGNGGESSVEVALGEMAVGAVETITFSTVITAPAGTYTFICQGSVTGSNFLPVVSDDPDTVAVDDPTVIEAAIPTLGQWGIIVLGLLFVIIGVLQVSGVKVKPVKL